MTRSPFSAIIEEKTNKQTQRKSRRKEKVVRVEDVPMVTRGHETFYSLRCGGIRFLLSLSPSLQSLCRCDGYKSSGQAGMWECDSDGGELPDRRQVAATQGLSAAVTRRESPPTQPAFLRAEAPPHRPPAGCWCQGDGNQRLSGERRKKHNTTKHTAEDKMSRRRVVFGL